MNEKLAEKLDVDEINLEKILEVKMEIIQDLIGEIEHMSSQEFIASSIKLRTAMLSEVRTSVHNIEKSERLLNAMMIKLFDVSYHNAIDSLGEV